MAFDYKKEYKEFYLPPKTPGIVTVPAMNFLAVRGHGNPNEENGAYKQAIGLLYAVAAFVLPGVEQMENDLLHLLRGVVLGKIPLHVLLIEEELLPLVGLFLGEQVMQVFTGQRPGLAHLFEGTGLGEGRSGLTGVHLFLEHLLMFLGQVGDLHRRIEGDLVIVYHLKDGGDQVGQTDVTLNCSSALIAAFCKYPI